MGKFAWLDKAFGWGRKALPGLGAFFGLEWLTNGGMQNAGSGIFGVESWAVSIVLIIGALLVGWGIYVKYLGPDRRSGYRRFR